MSPGETITLAGVVVSMVSAVFLPIYLVRRSEKRAVETREEAARAVAAASQNVTWEGINRAISAERDVANHQVAALRVELAEANRQIRECAAEIDKLNRQLNAR